MALYVKIFLSFNLLSTLACLSAQSDTLWTKTYHNRGWESFRSAKQTSDSGFICIGKTYAFTGPSDRTEDLWIVKVNQVGDTLWTKTLDINAVNETPGDVLEMKGFDYDLLIIGTVRGNKIPGSEDCLIMRTDQFGNIKWTKEYDYHETANRGDRVVQTSDNRFLVCGTTYDYLTLDKNIWLLLINAKGDTIWTKSYDLGYNNWEGAYSITQTSDGGFVLTGAISFKFTSPWDDLFIMKVDKDGNFLWSKLYGGSGFDDGECIKQTKDEGFVICGKYVGENNNGQLWLLKTDINGDTLWTHTYGGDKGEWGSSIELTDDGGYIICGTTETFGNGFWDIWVVKVDSLGNLLWSKTFGDLSGDTGSSIQKTYDGGFIVSGMKSSFGGSSQDGYLIRLTPEDISVIDEEYHTIPNNFFLSQNFPNPFNPSTTIFYQLPTAGYVTLKIYDVLGNEIVTLVNEDQPAGNYSVKFDATDHPLRLGRKTTNTLSSGVYFYQLRAGCFVETKKFILMK